MKKLVAQNLGIAIFAIALLFRSLFSFSQSFFNSLYFEGLFPVVRSFQSSILHMWILPGYYVLLSIIIGWFIWRFPRKKKWKLFFRRLANFLCGLMALFLFLWGMNYADTGFAKRKKIQDAPSVAVLSDHYLSTMKRAMSAREKIQGISQVSSIVEFNGFSSDSIINEGVRMELRSLGYPTENKIKVQHIRPAGTLRRLGISGIYNPFTGEANVDAALPNIQKIFTTAHEIAHAYGVSGEAEANFVAFLACIHSDEPIAQYAGEYALWRQMAGEINRNYPDEIRELLAASIPEDLLKDREAIIQAYYQYEAYFPEISAQLNDTYLKIQGIEKGTADYDGFLKLYLAWNDSQK